MNAAAPLSLDEFVAAEQVRTLPWTDKSAGTALLGRDSGSLANTPVALSELPTPMLTAQQPMLKRNIAAMQRWCDEKGVLLAPHGKTTMAPSLWRDQLEAGSWGITVATEAQLRVAVGCGVRRTHLANTLLSPDGLRWLAEELLREPQLLVQFWVDSVESVGLIDAVLATVSPVISIPVLVEVGLIGGRAGVRSRGQATDVAVAVSLSRHLRLVGVAGYEGAVHAATESEYVEVDRYLESIVDIHRDIEHLYAEGERFLSAGGSAHFDRVTSVLGAAAKASSATTRVLLRSGAYIAHDDGLYARITPGARGAGPALEAALHVWARVISTPEPGLAILDAGRRDMPFDQGLPTPQQLRRVLPSGGYGVRRDFTGTLTQLNDQHAFLSYDPLADVQPGDVIRFGISHPCTAFDKWRSIPTISSADTDDPLVSGLIHTYF